MQLEGRHWVVSNGAGETVAEVPRGSRGVVGCTPILKPGTCFQYYSGTDLDEPGTMRGALHMAVLDAKSKPLRKFDADVLPFAFSPPRRKEEGGRTSSAAN